MEDESNIASPPLSPVSEASSSLSHVQTNFPPPFSSLYSNPDPELSPTKAAVTDTSDLSLPTFVFPPPPLDPFDELPESPQESSIVADTKAALERDKKGESSGKGPEDQEPPPPYTEGSSPIESFTYIMAAAGGAASIITQVQQSGGPPINTLGGVL